jgi:F0F1-type ATP synthase assembly protein I
MEHNKKKEKSGRTKLSIIAELSAVGIQFPVSIAVGYFIGKYLDKVFSTYPWLTMIFSVLGVVSAFINVFRLNSNLNKIEKKENERKDSKNY